MRCRSRPGQQGRTCRVDVRFLPKVRGFLSANLGNLATAILRSPQPGFPRTKRTASGCDLSATTPKIYYQLAATLRFSDRRAVSLGEADRRARRGAFRRRAREWEGEGEPGAARRGLGPDLPTVGLDDSTGDVEPQS